MIATENYIVEEIKHLNQEFKELRQKINEETNSYFGKIFYLK